MIKQLRFLCCLLGLMLISLVAIGQPDGNNGKVPPGNPRNPRSPQIPIDGGASLLAAAGIAYGAKKVLDLRKKNADEPDQ